MRAAEVEATGVSNSREVDRLRSELEQKEADIADMERRLADHAAKPGTSRSQTDDTKVNYRHFVSFVQQLILLLVCVCIGVIGRRCGDRLSISRSNAY